MNESQDDLKMVRFVCPHRPGSHGNLDYIGKGRRWARHRCGYGCEGPQIAVDNSNDTSRLLEAAMIICEIAAHGDVTSGTLGGGMVPVNAEPGELAAALYLAVTSPAERGYWTPDGTLYVEQVLEDVRARYV